MTSVGLHRLPPPPGARNPEIDTASGTDDVLGNSAAPGTIAKVGTLTGAETGTELGTCAAPGNSATPMINTTLTTGATLGTDSETEKGVQVTYKACS